MMIMVMKEEIMVMIILVMMSLVSMPLIMLMVMKKSEESPARLKTTVGFDSTAHGLRNFFACTALGGILLLYLHCFTYYFTFTCTALGGVLLLLALPYAYVHCVPSFFLFCLLFLSLLQQ